MRRRPAFAAACAVVMLVVGQLAALAHQAGTRHVTCGEHGEVLEAPTLVEQLHACDQDHLVGIEGNASDHDGCEITRALQQSAQTPQRFVVAQRIPLVTTSETVTTADNAVATALYLIAPKTSPPTLA